MADLVTAEELGAFLQVPNLDAGNAAPVIAGVSEQVRRYTGRAWAAVDDEKVRLDGNGSSSLLLPRLPVRELSSVVEDPDGAGRELESIDWNADGMLRRLDGVFARRLRWYEVTYSHGEAVPADVKLVVLRVCARGAVNPEGAVQETTGGYTALFAQDSTRLAVLSPPDRLELAAYRVTV